MQNSLSLTNTRVAFSTRSDRELYKQYRLFGLLRHRWVVKAGARITFLAFRFHLPIANLIRRTIFRQFCAGENLNESIDVIKELRRHNVGSILDYSVEGEGTEQDLENIKLELYSVLQLGGLTSMIPYACLKLTAIIPTPVLEKLSVKRELSSDEEAAYFRGSTRFSSICREAQFNNIPIYIDAEESWYQNAIDRLTEDMMWKFNETSARVGTTVQMYRSDRLEYLRHLIETAKEKKRFIAVKLVRGAYMEKESERAKQMGYVNPINAGKEITDDHYHKALELCLENSDIVSLCVGTHNEASTLYATGLMKKFGIPNASPKVYFSQLYGMSDHITFNLAAHGYNVVKYLPYGPVKSVLPYLVRRAEENTAIAGQMGRELSNLKSELSRRRRERAVKQLNGTEK